MGLFKNQLPQTLCSVVPWVPQGRSRGPSPNPTTQWMCIEYCERSMVPSTATHTSETAVRTVGDKTKAQYKAEPSKTTQNPRTPCL
jgi:hypothetical protein